MSDRATRVHRWLYKTDDDLYDRLEAHLSEQALDELWDKALDRVFRLAHRTACSVLGHSVWDDHCRIPEHRHCAVCHQHFPNGLVGQTLTNRPNPEDRS
jgi:hypothetical protein